MVKINEHEAIITREDLRALIGVIGPLNPLDDLFIDHVAGIQMALEEHIWGEKQLPEDELAYARQCITKEPPKKETQPESYTVMCSICKLLTAALQITRQCHDLVDIKYDPHSGTIVEFTHGHHIIDTEGDSGIAMIRKILAYL